MQIIARSSFVNFLNFQVYYVLKDDYCNSISAVTLSITHVTHELNITECTRERMLYNSFYT